MKDYFARLSSLERRFVVGVLVVVFVLLNMVFVRPHFADWGELQFKLGKLRKTLGVFQAEVGETPKYEKLVRTLESEGLSVPPDDQAIDFMRNVQSQAAQVGVNIVNIARVNARTNVFFLEQGLNLSVQSVEQPLVDFLYNLGSGNSLTRVRDLTLRPDPQRHELAANIKLVASYQKKAPARPAASAAAGKTATPTAKKP